MMMSSPVYIRVPQIEGQERSRRIYGRWLPQRFSQARRLLWTWGCDSKD
jgi:hypothetical protein